MRFLIIKILCKGTWIETKAGESSLPYQCSRYFAFIQSRVHELSLTMLTILWVSKGAAGVGMKSLPIYINNISLDTLMGFPGGSFLTVPAKSSAPLSSGISVCLAGRKKKSDICSWKQNVHLWHVIPCAKASQSIDILNVFFLNWSQLGCLKRIFYRN